MAIVRATLFFEQLGRGWTESYWRDSGSASLADQFAIVDVLAAKRIKCSGVQTFLRYARVSAEGVFRDAAVRTYTGAGLPGLSSENSDVPTTCLLVRCRNATFTKLKFVYLRGIWDSIVTAGGTFIPGASFTAYFNDFAAALVQGAWGWLGADVTTKVNIANVVQELNGTVTITAAANVFPGPPFPRTTVRIAGVQGAVAINGPQIVQATAATICHTTKRIPIFPYTTGGTLAYQTKALIPITQATPDRIAERKVGNVSYVSRGRRRALARS